MKKQEQQAKIDQVIKDYRHNPTHQDDVPESDGPTLKLFKSWRDDEPTEKQINYLARLGHAGEPPDTKGEACDLIAKILKTNGHTLI